MGELAVHALPGVAEVGELAVHALPGVAEVGELAFHALPGVAEVGALAVHALPGGAEVGELAFHALPGGAEVGALADAVVAMDPRAFTGAPARPDPGVDAPHPPSGDLGVVEVGVRLHTLEQPRPSGVDEPQVSGEQVDLVDRPVAPHGDRFGVMCECPPEVGEEPVCVVDGLRPTLTVEQVVRSTEEYRERPGERLDVVVDVAEGGPDLSGDPPLAAEPDERSLERHSVSRW